MLLNVRFFIYLFIFFLLIKNQTTRLLLSIVYRACCYRMPVVCVCGVCCVPKSPYYIRSNYRCGAKKNRSDEHNVCAQPLRECTHSKAIRCPLRLVECAPVRPENLIYATSHRGHVCVCVCAVGIISRARTCACDMRHLLWSFEGAIVMQIEQAMEKGHLYTTSLTDRRLWRVPYYEMWRYCQT